MLFVQNDIMLWLSHLGNVALNFCKALSDFAIDMVVVFWALQVPSSSLSLQNVMQQHVTAGFGFFL